MHSLATLQSTQEWFFSDTWEKLKVARWIVRFTLFTSYLIGSGGIMRQSKLSQVNFSYLCHNFATDSGSRCIFAFWLLSFLLSFGSSMLHLCSCSKMDRCKIISESQMCHLFFEAFLFTYQKSLYQFGKTVFWELVESMCVSRLPPLRPFHFWSHRCVK